MLSEVHKTPNFNPHVTLVGGVKIHPDEIQNTMLKLHESFAGFGSIPCKFDRSKGIMAGYDEESKTCKWNQSTVAILLREDKLIKAIEMAREALLLGLDNNNAKDAELFKPPLYEPHLSLAYGYEPLGHLVKDFPPDFDSNVMVLVCTDPSTLEGVSSWKEIGRIALDDVTYNI